jgi:hypothetical protein
MEPPSAGGFRTRFRASQAVDPAGCRELSGNPSFLGQKGTLAGSPVAGQVAFASGPFGGEAALSALDMAGHYVLLLCLIALRLGRRSLP